MGNEKQIVVDDNVSEGDNLQEQKHWFDGLLPNRDAYSWFVIILIVIGEGLALWGLRSEEWLFFGPGVFISIAIGVFLVHLGRKANHIFGIRSVILTKLLANAISPRPLGTIYLLFFVIHVGWLTNAAMLLFTPTANFCDVMIAAGTCVLGMAALICFFPVGSSQKAAGSSKVFVSGMSFISVPRDGYDKLNLIPLVRILQLMEQTKSHCRLIILKTSALVKYSKDNPDKFVGQTETFFKVMQVIKAEYDKVSKYYGGTNEDPAPDFNRMLDDIRNSTDEEEQVEILIRAIVFTEFPDRRWMNGLLDIEFTKACDYNKDFEGCFAELNSSVSPLDDENHQLYFNCTPGTSTVGSVMTLLAIDGDRKLYYYSQEEMTAGMTPLEKLDFKAKLLKPVDKNKIPLYNLLSQALDKFEKRV